MEAGASVNLLPSPITISHGTDAHALWLYHKVKKDGDVSASACGYAQFKRPENEAEKQARVKHQTKCGAAVAKLNSFLCKPKEHIPKIANSAQGPTNTMRSLHCPHCKLDWVVYDPQGFGRHTC